MWFSFERPLSFLQGHVFMISFTIFRKRKNENQREKQLKNGERPSESVVTSRKLNCLPDCLGRSRN